MRISDWSSDVCSSDLGRFVTARTKGLNLHRYAYAGSVRIFDAAQPPQFAIIEAVGIARVRGELRDRAVARGIGIDAARQRRSEEHTSELQSLMRISYAVFCLKKKNAPITCTQSLTRITS